MGFILASLSSPLYPAMSLQTAAVPEHAPNMADPLFLSTMISGQERIRNK
jgi:hypothetical protein